MHHDLNAGLCEAAELIEVSECIQKGRVPPVPAARCFRSFGQPDRLAGLELFPKRPVKGECQIGPGEPFFRKSFLRRARTTAALRKYSIVMIRDHIQAARACCSEHVRGGGCCASSARTEDEHFRIIFFHKRAEYLEITRIGCRIVSGRRTAGHGDIRLVHEFGCRDAPPDRVGVGEKATSLVRQPDACRIAGTRTDGE